ncbi:MAG: hypothetical protein ACE5EI_10350 [Thermodesulfobacteriota bacterium]
MTKEKTIPLYVKKLFAAALFAVIPAVLVLSLSGCGGGEKKPAPKAKAAPAATEAAPAESGAAKLPEGHAQIDKFAEDIQKMSHSNIKTSKELSLSDEVKAKWKDVTLDITDFASRQTASVKFEVGSTVKLNDEGARLHVVAFVPDYAIVEDRIESRSNEPVNPAVLIELLDGDKVVTRGWVFRDFPDFNSFNDQRFGVALAAPAAKDGKPAE